MILKENAKVDSVSIKIQLNKQRWLRIL